MVTPEDIQKIVEYLTNLMGPIVSAGYDLVYRQVLFNTIWDGVMLILCVVLIVALPLILRKIAKATSENMFYIFNLFLILPVFAGFGLLYSILNFVINPNWMVIQFLLDNFQLINK